ncbi:MAG: hypothetical protein EXS16_02735 [Gemmataceae bacterium]|nr:hypothetical protein [Gemmataceae bacterium]
MNPENIQPTNTFLWQRLSEECPIWAIFVPVMFGFVVVSLIVFFRQERKWLAAIIGGGIVGALTLIYLPIAFLLVTNVKHIAWLVILVPLLSVALVYVVLMYIRDSRSVHWLWAIFLGTLRLCVYGILAIVFLLPGCQYFEQQEYHAKVIFLFDVSGSMFVRDDLPEEGQDPDKLPTRQDKIVSLLTAVQRDTQGKESTFIDQILQKSPVTAYRFGHVLDEGEALQLTSKNNIKSEDLAKWLSPNKKHVKDPLLDEIKDEKLREEKQAEYQRRLDLIDGLKSGTNVAGACLQMHNLEGNGLLQVIVVISDGQSNIGSDEARSDFINRVSGSRRSVPVITIGVGQFRLPASIRIDDIQAPEETRPDDKFPARVTVVGTGLHGEDFNVLLEIRRVKDVTGKPVEEEPFNLEPRKGTFKGQGDHPQGIVEFEIDVQELKKIVAKDDKDGQLEGEWHLKARVPKNAKESFKEKFHVTDPVKVQIQKRALRVLLFASGATREYQFLRTIIFREMSEKRMEMCVCLQNGREDHVDQDVEAERMLSDFPNTIGVNLGQKHMSLTDHDIIIAFDPDWSKLSDKQLKNLKEWVETHSGGVIFVAGPVHSFQLARPAGRDINALLAIYPVVLKDSRLHALGLPGSGLGHDSSRPYALNFSPAAKQFDFLKLDEAGESPTAGWNAFFWNEENYKGPTDGTARPRRGVYTFYPVERLKPDSSVIATFAGPKEARINSGKDEQPFLVSMRVGSGKTLYVGSGEFWRLRSFKDGYHERLWIKMARYVAAGATQQKKYGRLLIARSVPVGPILVEAHLKGKDLLALSRDLTPTVFVKKIDKLQEDKGETGKFDLKPKPSDDDWRGYFQETFRLTEPGEYEFRLPVPGTNETLRQNVIVRKPNPEMDNVRTNFGYLYQLSSDAGPFIQKLPAAVRKEIESAIQIPVDAPGVGDRGVKRLFFPLQNADAVAKCIQPVPPKMETTKGKFERLWDQGGDTGLPELSAKWLAILMPLVIGLIGVVLLLIMRQPLNALAFFGICFALSMGIVGVDFFFSDLLSEYLPVQLSFVMMTLVSLLGIEWLARKLLRLA